MAKLGLSSRLNSVTKKSSEVDVSGYKRVVIDPETLVPAEENFYSQEDIEELADNMILVGNLQPIIVGRVDGKDKVIAGHRRRQAILMNKRRGIKEFEKIEVLMKEMSENMFMLTLISANMYNRKLTDWEIVEQARQFKEYLKRASKEDGVVIEGKMRDYIADCMGVSNTKMAQIEKINNSLCEEGKEALKNGEINFTTAYETSKLDVEKQKEVIGNKHLLSKDVKELVEQQKVQEEQKEDYTIPGQTTIDEYVNFEPQPDKVQSVCYSCTHWNECDQKGNTVTKCNEYSSKEETYKTDEQRYNEQQLAIDRETKKKVQQMEDEKKMSVLPSEQKQEKKVHRIKEASMYYDEVRNLKKTFELRKNDRNYCVGDGLELVEYKDGQETNRCLYADIVYILEDYNGLEEGYCILGIRVTGETV